MGTPVYPSAIKAFTTKQDGIDTVIASHVNVLQDEVVSLQNHVGANSELPPLTLPAGSAVAARISPQISGLKSWVDHLNTIKAPVASPTFTGTVTLPSTTSIGGVSNTQLGYLSTVTSNVQDQLNLKAPISNPTITGTLSVGSSPSVIRATVNGSTGAASVVSLSVDGQLALGGSGYISRSGNVDIYSYGGELVARTHGGAYTTVVCAPAGARHQAATLANVQDDDGYYRELQVSDDGTYRSLQISDDQYYWNLSNGTFYIPGTTADIMYTESTDVNHPNSVVNMETVNQMFTNHVKGYTHSSRELKNDIKPLTTGAVLFDQVSPVTFKYKSHEEDSRVPSWFDPEQTRIGFIAEDVRDAGIPIEELTTPGEDPTLGLALPDLIAVLWAKVKEQDARIAELEAQR